MIQLATDPDANRNGFRSAQASERPRASSPQRLRGGHAWPFLSRPVGQPAPRDAGKNPASGPSGS